MLGRRGELATAQLGFSADFAAAAYQQCSELTGPSQKQYKTVFLEGQILASYALSVSMLQSTWTQMIL
jgi:hypothetical protein